MTTIGRLTRILLLTALGASVAGCIHLEDSITQYTERSDKVVLSSGNAKDANVAMHMIDPWPRSSADRRIPADGQRMVGAVERYRDPTKQPPLPPRITPPQVQGTSGPSAGTAAGAAR